MTSPELPILAIVIIAAMIFRFRKIISGGRVNRNRIIGSTALYVGISFFTVFSSFQAGVSIEYLFVYFGLLAGSAYLSYRFVGKTLTLWKTDDGFIHVKGGIFPYLVWLVSLVARFVLGYLFLGSNFLNAYGTQKTLSASAVEITLIVDLIMMIGVGVLTGRNIQILSRLKNFQIRNEKSSTDTFKQN
ncbi:MAG: hypothetical protein ACREBB_11990 [Nitrosotalea sp.]